MAEVCAPTLEGVSPIATRPLNLSLLTKKRAMEGLYENDAEDACGNKRLRRDDDTPEHEKQEEEIVVHDEKPPIYQQSHYEGDRSKSSILEHFYSFIRRKTDDAVSTIRPAEDDSKYRERDEHPPSLVISDDRSDCDSDKSRHNGSLHPLDRRISPPTTPERALMDYNAALSRHLAARGGPTAIMDIWNVVAANAIARAKGHHVKDLQRASPPFPTLVGLGNDYEPKNNYVNTTSATTIPERTMRQNNWAVKVWRDWAIERNSRTNINARTGKPEIVPLDIKDASLELMSYWLPRFITEVRRRDKRPYPPDTLMQIASGLQRHLRHVSGRSDITFFDKYSPTFAEFREALKARSDEINSKLSSTRRDASSSSPPGSDQAAHDPWSSSLFNLNTAKGLFRAIFYSNCVTFHITSMEEHHSLMVSQFHIGLDSKSGQEYLEFTRDNGEVTRKYASSFDPRCVVKIFKKYFDCIPPTGLLYKRPLQSTDGADLRFSFNPVGINKLRETFKTLFGGRRSGVHIPVEDDEDRDGRSPPMRYHSVEEDLRRYTKFNHSPSSNASSGRASVQDEESGEEIRRNSEQTSDERPITPPRSVITFASENKSDITAKKEPTTPMQAISDENNNNNSSKTEEDDDRLTLKVPAYVKSVIILQGGKRFQVDLTAMT